MFYKSFNRRNRVQSMYYHFKLTMVYFIYFFLCLKKFYRTGPFKYFNHFYFSSVSKYEHTEVFPQWWNMLTVYNYMFNCFNFFPAKCTTIISTCYYQQNIVPLKLRISEMTACGKHPGDSLRIIIFFYDIQSTSFL